MQRSSIAVSRNERFMSGFSCPYGAGRANDVATPALSIDGS
jgi:hypothetical protein